MSGRGRRRRDPFPPWLFWIMATAGAVVVVLATVSLAHYLAFRRAVQCPANAPATSCLSQRDTEIAAISSDPRHDAVTLSFTGAPGIPEAVLSSGDTARMRAGDPVRVEMWEGDVVAVSDSGRTAETYASQSTSPIGILAGAGLLGFAFAGRWWRRRFLARLAAAAAPAATR